MLKEVQAGNLIPLDDLYYSESTKKYNLLDEKKYVQIIDRLIDCGITDSADIASYIRRIEDSRFALLCNERFLSGALNVSKSGAIFSYNNSKEK